MASVIEFEPPRSLDHAAAGREGADRPHGAATDRMARIHATRTANYRAMSSVYDEVERLSFSAVGLAPELTRSAPDPVVGHAGLLA